MPARFEDNRFDVMTLAMEVANDVVAFDSHLVLLEADGKRKAPRVVWQYEEGTCYAGKEYEKWVRTLLEDRRRFKSGKYGQEGGFVKKKKCGYVVEMRHQGALKGVLLVWRLAADKFSKADARLLKAVAALAAAAMCELEAMALLERLHLHFLDRRTAAFQAEDVRDVLELYLEKVEYVFHPGLLVSQLGERPPVGNVRSSAKLVTENGTALYIAAARSATNKDGFSIENWPGKKLRTRYDADGKSSITAWVFAKERPYMTNDYEAVPMPIKRLFRDVRSHMSAPIVAGSERCHGVLSVETGGENKYTELHCDALALLAGHGARPLGRARDRELGAGRLADLDVIRDMTHAFQECESWAEIESLLCDDMPKLRYNRGAICEVLYEKKLVVGSAYWGRNMREVCRTTRRHFVRNRNDCQVKAVMQKAPQVISDPRQDPAAHRDAVRMGALGPFAIIPGIDSRKKVRWTLHVEREDTAPIGLPEVASLQGICRAAMAARERLENAAGEREMTTVALAWAQTLQVRFSRQIEVLESFAEFVVKYVCSRCRVYATGGKELLGVCYAGQRLGRVRNFRALKVRSVVPNLESVLKRERGPIIARLGGVHKDAGLQREFKVVTVRSFSRSKALEREGILELVELPLFVEGVLKYVVVFDKKGRAHHHEETTFRSEEIRLLATLGRLTCIALERTNLAEHVFRQASVGTAMGVFRHEIAQCMRKLSLHAALYRKPSQGKDPSVGRLVSTIDRETGRMRKLREFFSDEVFKERVSGGKTTSVGREIDSAIRLLGHSYSEMIQGPQEQIRVRVPSRLRPLCLILLQLLSNAIQAAQVEKDGVKVSFQRGRGRSPHVLSVSNKGRGIGEATAEKLRTGVLRGWPPQPAFGLACAQLVAAAEGWTLRLARRKDPTRFEILIPRHA